MFGNSPVHKVFIDFVAEFFRTFHSDNTERRYSEVGIERNFRIDFHVKIPLFLKFNVGPPDNYLQITLYMIFPFYTIDIFDNVYQNIKPSFETKTPCHSKHGVISYSFVVSIFDTSCLGSGAFADFSATCGLATEFVRRFITFIGSVFA